MSVPLTKLDYCYFLYSSNAGRMEAYIAALQPSLLRNPDALAMFVESTVVLMVAWNEAFLSSLLAGATEPMEPQVRSYLAQHGSDTEKEIALTCERKRLIAMLGNRVKLTKQGRRLDRVFDVLFGVSPWPSAAVKSQLFDLNLLRQLIVHHGGGHAGDEYWDQFTSKSLLTTKHYDGLPRVINISHMAVARFLPAAFAAMSAQANHIRAGLLANPVWRYQGSTKPSGGGATET